VSFDEVRFPTDISLGASGGPERRTDIVQLASGFEERNSTWANSRRRWDAGYGVKTLDDLSKVVDFFEARMGRLYGFRWRDGMDFKSCRPSAQISAADQALGTGTGAGASFQLKKAYTSGGRTWLRTITKPVRGAVKVAVAGAEKIEGTDFTVDYATGLVTINATLAAAITAGFEFDVPARFDTDKLEISLEAFKGGSIPQIPIVEIRV
jgi:uncharacterized protein (TIGR02217 family)